MKLTRSAAATLVLAAGAFAGGGWLASSSPQSWEDQLRPFETQLLSRRTPGTPGDEQRRGAEPWRVLRLDSGRSVVLLRHSSEAVLLDPGLRELARLPVPDSPAVAAPLAGDRLLVAGELSNRIALVEAGPSSLRLVDEVQVGSVAAWDDLLPVGNRLFGIDRFERRLLVMDWKLAGQRLQVTPRLRYEMGAGLQSLHRVGDQLLVHVQHQRRLWLLPLSDPDPDSAAALKIDFEGPILGLTTVVAGGRTWLALGAIEDRPLDRRQGEFGFVDSYVHLLRLEEDASGCLEFKPEWRDDPDRFQTLNTSERGVVTPRALLALPGPQPSMLVAGFGSGTLARLDYEGGRWRLASLGTIPPGVTEMVTEAPGPGTTLLAASTLADLVIRLDVRGTTLARWRAPDPTARDPAERLGELLTFTTLMAPDNSSAGQLSRLSCEACHLEGDLDGRTHFTGRDEVYATTKPLRGMADNVPLFSRGGDPDFASMVPAEFDAINQDRHGTFTLSAAEVEWLRGWPGIDPVVGPSAQRRALLAFLFGFDHRPNPWRRRGGLDPVARAGLIAFRDRCEHCHQARTTTRRDSAVPFAEWPRWLEGRQDLVWAAPFFSQTGIEPYVDPAGARVPSLRRVWLKTPYFTNGSSGTIADVLSRFRYRDYQAWHHWEGDDQTVRALTPAERRQLEALLKYF